MADVEMQIVDLDPADPLKFALDQYAKQLVAGNSRTLPDRGLEVFMRDLAKIGGTQAGLKRDSNGTQKARPNGMGAGTTPPGTKPPWL
ncbi:MAG: hypothetical protein ABI311_11260 [Gemmatimonadaceae bacterium]